MNWKILILGIAILATLGLASANQFTYNFTTCGSTGASGPSQTDCDNEYSGTNLEGDVSVVGEGVQEWDLSSSGRYQVRVEGAEGGDGDNGVPGKGAIVEGELYLDNTENLRVLVGQQGLSSGENSGGGGGTFIWKSGSSEPLLAAGGGGGTGDGGQACGTVDGMDAITSTSGTDTRCGNYVGGSDGEGGTSGSSGAGAGWLTDGEGGSQGGQAITNGGLGGSQGDASGGFGGAGADGSSPSDSEGGGAGGGYSGGAASDGSTDGAAGGGGSFIRSDVENPATSDGGWTTTGSEPHSVYTGSVSNLGEWSQNDGKVVIELLSEVENPRPSSNAYDVERTNASVNLSVRLISEMDNPRNLTFYNASNDTVIGAVENVSSGQRATVEWSGLDSSSKYEWYVETEDNGSVRKNPAYQFETLRYQDSFTVNSSKASSNPEGSNSSLIRQDNQTLDLSIFVYRNNDSYAENVWAEIDHLEGSTYKYSLNNSTALNNSQEFYREINISQEGLPTGNYEVSFYANGTDVDGNLTEQNRILNETFHITEGICDRGGYDTECEVRSEKNLGDGEIISGAGRLQIQDGGLLKNGDGYRESAELNFSQIKMFDGSGVYANINLTAENITVSNNAYINATGLGYGSYSGPGAPGGSGYEEGGGGFGGYGGDGQNSEGGPAYSLPENPLATAEGYGSGGFNDGSDVKSGGGRIIIEAENAVLDGSLRADGTTGSDSDSSGGSGGSIVVNATAVNGSGLLSVQGGPGNSDAGSGGGGRIAFIDDTWEGKNLSLNAQGGTGATGYGENGYAGTIYPQSICDSGSLTTTCNVSSQYNVYEPVIGSGTLNILSGGSLISNGDIDIDIANLSVKSGGEIKAENGALNINSTRTDIIGSAVSSTPSRWNSTEITVSGTANTGGLRIISSGVEISGTINSGVLNLSDLQEEKQLNVSGTVYASSTLDLNGLMQGTYHFNESGKLLGNNLDFNQSALDSLELSNGVFGINGTRNVLPVTSNSVIVGSGSTLRGNMAFNLTNLTVEPGGKIDAEGLGYQAGNGPGYDGRYCGAGFGGRGGGSNADTCVGGSPYSNITDPLIDGNGFGSGGRNNGYAHGGGKIIVEASNFQNNGVLAADAELFSNYGHSGGSGGTVIVDSPNITGDGSVLARGANATGGSNYGGGGGGRVVFEDQSWSASNISIDVSGGQPSGNDAEPGVTGTYYPFNTICDTGGLNSTCVVERFYQDVNESVSGTGDLVLEQGAGLESNNELNISMNSVTTKSDSVLRAANGPLNINASENLNLTGEAYATATSEWRASNISVNGYLQINRSERTLFWRPRTIST